MTNPAETGPTGADRVQQDRHQVAEEIRKAASKQAKREVVERILDTFLNRREMAAADIQYQLSINRGRIPPEKLKGAQAVTTSLSQVFELMHQVRAGNIPPELMPAIPQRSFALLEKINSRIGTQLTDESASSIYPLVKTLLQRELSGRELEGEFDRVVERTRYNPYLARYLSEAIQDAAREGGLDMTPEEARAKFEAPEEPAEAGNDGEKPPGPPDDERMIETGRGGRRGRDNSFDYFWGQFSNYFSEKDADLIQAVVEPDRFYEFASKEKEKVSGRLQRERPDATQAEIDLEFSRHLRDRMVRVFSKIYARLDLEKPREFFERIVEEDIFTGIRAAVNRFKQSLRGLATYSREHEAQFEDLHMIQEIGMGEKPEEKEYEITLPDGTKRKVKKADFRLNLLRNPLHVDMETFIHYTETVMEHYVTAREYTHNVRASFFKPAGEKGFYGGLAGYAENWPMIELDEMFLLPDSGIMTTALQLYDKYVEESFAFRDWKHTPTQFTEEMGSLYSQLENQTLAALKSIYPDASEEQLRGALSMAIGASRGIFMTEVEKAAFADPELNPDGKFTFTSYYTNDTAALAPLNPQHFFWRFQQEVQLNPIYFLPLSELGKSLTKGTWNHAALFKRQAAYRRSFLEGRTPTLGGEELFMDFMVNIGHIGGILQRKGWRTGAQLENHYVLGPNRSVNFLETWKALENIGYEALWDFVVLERGGITDLMGAYLSDRDKASLEAGNLSGKKKENAEKQKKAVDKREEFFRYLFSQYFGLTDQTFDQYFEALRGEVTDSTIKKIKDKKMSPESLEAGIEEEASRTFLLRTLSRVIAKRIPSKFLRIDRDRFSADGDSRWKKIMMAMELGEGQWTQFDAIMKDLLLAENLLRKEVSETMKPQYERGIPLQNIEVDFRLTADKVRSLLSKVKGMTPERIENTIRLFNLIQERYSGTSEEAQKFLNGFADYINDKKKFTLAFDDTDVSFIPFRAAGPRVMPRALGDIANIEQKVVNPLLKFHNVLHEVAISGKRDFSKILQVIREAKETLQSAISLEYGQKVAAYLGMLTIAYFKKDSRAKSLGGFLHTETLNSIAAEVAQRSSAVWEWEARDIDAFCTALESTNILKKMPFDLSKPNVEATYEPVWINLFGKPVKLSFLKRRKKDFAFSSRDLREFGGKPRHIVFDILNKYLPIFIIFLLWKFINDAMKENEKKK